MGDLQLKDFELLVDGQPRDIAAIVVGAGDPPRADERAGIRELATLVAAVAQRRPEMPIVLSGSMSEGLDIFGDVGARPGEVASFIVHRLAAARPTSKEKAS